MQHTDQDLAFPRLPIFIGRRSPLFSAGRSAPSPWTFCFESPDLCTLYHRYLSRSLLRIHCPSRWSNEVGLPVAICLDFRIESFIKCWKGILSFWSRHFWRSSKVFQPISTNTSNFWSNLLQTPFRWRLPSAFYRRIDCESRSTSKSIYIVYLSKDCIDGIIVGSALVKDYLEAVCAFGYLY